MCQYALQCSREIPRFHTAIFYKTRPGMGCAQRNLCLPIAGYHVDVGRRVVVRPDHKPQAAEPEHRGHVP